jgi:tetratricopeptide (TPR) repeat protein
MKRAVLTLITIFLVTVLVGCGGVDTGRSQLIPAGTREKVQSARASETDIIEQMMSNRQAYRQSMEQLVQHYTETGNNMKLNWARREQKGLNKVQQYNYIIEATVAGPGLKATTEIAEAELLYAQAYQDEDRARQFVVVVNEDLLRVALDKYNQLIRKHPSSTRIADAAFRAGGIYEYFKDYTLAMLYYRRVYQWDPETEHPAMFREAFILDTKLHRRDEALELYQKALKATRPGQHETWVEYAQKRIDKFMGKEKKGK